MSGISIVSCNVRSMLLASYPQLLRSWGYYTCLFQFLGKVRFPSLAGTVLGLCRIESSAAEAQQEARYMFSPRIHHLNYYAVLCLLICSLSGHQPEEARVRYLETRGALNSSSIQGMSQFLLVIQSVQLQKLSIIVRTR